MVIGNEQCFQLLKLHDIKILCFNFDRTLSKIEKKNVARSRVRFRTHSRMTSYLLITSWAHIACKLSSYIISSVVQAFVYKTVSYNKCHTTQVANLVVIHNRTNTMNILCRICVNHRKKTYFTLLYHLLFSVCRTTKIKCKYSSILLRIQPLTCN